MPIEEPPAEVGRAHRNPPSTQDDSLVLHPVHFPALHSSSLSQSGLHSSLQPARGLGSLVGVGGGGAKPGRPTPLQVLQGLWPPHQDTPELGLTLALPWQVLALARQQNKRVKVVGGGHSPSDIACTDGFMIHMGKMNRVLQVLRASAPPTSAILRPSNLSLYPRPQGP